KLPRRPGRARPRGARARRRRDACRWRAPRRDLLLRRRGGGSRAVPSPAMLSAARRAAARSFAHATCGRVGTESAPGAAPRADSVSAGVPGNLWGWLGLEGGAVARVLVGQRDRARRSDRLAGA